MSDPWPQTGMHAGSKAHTHAPEYRSTAQHSSFLLRPPPPSSLFPLPLLDIATTSQEVTHGMLSEALSLPLSQFLGLYWWGWGCGGFGGRGGVARRGWTCLIQQLGGSHADSWQRLWRSEEIAWDSNGGFSMHFAKSP